MTNLGASPMSPLSLTSASSVEPSEIAIALSVPPVSIFVPIAIGSRCRPRRGLAVPVPIPVTPWGACGLIAQREKHINSWPSRILLGFTHLVQRMQEHQNACAKETTNG